MEKHTKRFSLLPNFGFKFIFTHWSRLSGSTSFILNSSGFGNLNIYQRASLISLNWLRQLKILSAMFLCSVLYDPVVKRTRRNGTIALRSGKISGHVWEIMNDETYLESLRIRNVLKILTIRKNKASSTLTWSDKSVFISVSKTYNGSK